MQILIYATNYFPEVTGSGRYTAEMASWMAARGHTVTVITAPPHYPAWKVDRAYRGLGITKETLKDVQVLRAPLYVPSPANASALRRILMESSFTLSSSVWWIRQIFGRKKPDVVIAICPPTQTIVWPWIMKAIRRAPVVFHIQDLQFDAAIKLGMLGSRRLVGVLSAVERAALSSATHVSTISRSMREKIVGKGISESRISIVPNWASVHPEGDEIKLSSLRSAHGVSPDQLMVLYSGNLGQKQGLATLLEAAHELRDEHSIKFLVVGRGADEQKLKEHATRINLTNLRFSDLVPEEALPTLLTAADLHLIMQEEAAADLVMPSKLTNILAVGRPSIATALYESELGRVLVDNEAGVIVPPGDPKALAAAIKELASDPALRTKIGRNARAFADENLDINSIMLRLETNLKRIALKRSLVGRNPPSSIGEQHRK